MFGDAILALARKERPLLFLCTVTEEIPAAAVLRPSLMALGVAVFSPDPAMALVANDKYRTARFLFAEGVSVPRTLSDLECPSPLDAGEALGYPFVAKPRYGRGGRGVRVVRDEAMAAEEHRPGMAYQEFVGGVEYDVNLFAYPAGNSALTRVLIKTGLKEGIVGNATGVLPASCPDVRALAEDAVRAMQLEGPIEMDIRLTEGGIPKILEVNARVGVHVLQAEGVLDHLWEVTQALQVHL
jgi:carbamoyl-phosphate synthase large subunit